MTCGSRCNLKQSLRNTSLSIDLWWRLRACLRLAGLRRVAGDRCGRDLALIVWVLRIGQAVVAADGATLVLLSTRGFCQHAPV